MTDEALAERTRQGSVAAFEELVNRHRDAVYRIAHNLCSARDTEKVVQGTFLSAYRKEASRPAGSFRTWLYGLALTAATERSPARSPAPMESFLPAFDDRGQLAGRSEWPELPGAPITGLLREAFGCLDHGLRAAFVLREVVDLPAEDAAVLLEVPPEVVRERVHRARLILRAFLHRLWGETSA